MAASILTTTDLTWTNTRTSSEVSGITTTNFRNAVYGIRTGSIGFYGQDTWKVLHDSA